MSGTFPFNTRIRASKLKSIWPTIRDQTDNGRHWVREIGFHQWAFSLDLSRMVADDWRVLLAFVHAQRGMTGSFQIVHPALATPRGVLGGTPVVNGAGQSGSSLAISGCAASTVGWMKAGDVFTLAGNDKVYMLTADANTNASGQVTLNFEPQLIVSPAGGEALTVSNVPFTMFITNSAELAFSPPLRGVMSLSLAETISG